MRAFQPGSAGREGRRQNQKPLYGRLDGSGETCEHTNSFTWRQERFSHRSSGPSGRWFYGTNEGQSCSQQLLTWSHFPNQVTSAFGSRLLGVFPEPSERGALNLLDC
ncbi:hypothetical protein EYF80_054843 [Liparis tanakae]|uniref:Uncharacterized protein n=1 Tax=Liparis tanakae TaxID=230148 RepID=A0A4Z2F1A4_9TELE|nr:hypothetical protein EYF80_054843 [Liparis tanakae]